MKSLAEFIRLGSTQGPQLFGQLHHDGATCAMGAALLAAGLLKDYGEFINCWNYDQVEQEFPTVYVASKCPECGYASSMTWATWGLIVHLNNEHRWTRERIAAFVETLEETQQQEKRSEHETVGSY